MALPEYVATFLHGPLAIVVVVLIFGTVAILRLLAGWVAIHAAKPEDRSATALEVLNILCRRGQSPPSPPSGSPPVNQK